MNWRLIGGTALGLFAAGMAAGYYARKQGIPQEEIPRWLLKGATRKLLHAYDGMHEMMPARAPQPLAQALPQGEAGDGRAAGEPA